MSAALAVESDEIEEAEAASPALLRLRSQLPEAFRSRLRSARELGREVREAEGVGPFATNVPFLDRLLEGGLPRGQLVELVGARSSGRFSTLLSVLAAATGIGETAALVDLGDGLDPEAARDAGVDLARLLWLRPTNLKQALAAAEMVLDGGFPFVALDLGLPPVRGGRGVEAGWLRLARAARAHDAVLLVGTPYRVSGTAAGVVLKAGRARAAWQGGAGSPWLLGGVAGQLALEKCRGRLPGQTEGLELAVKDAPRPAAPRPALRPRAVPSPGQAVPQPAQAAEPREAPRLRVAAG